MVDGKMVSILQGDGGSPCHFCDSTTSDINDVISILQGFTISKNFETCMETWQKVATGEIAWGSSDRKGQCHKPIASVQFQGVLHWKLRSFDFTLQVYYRLIAGVYVWGDRKENARQMAFVAAAKQEAIDFIRKSTGMLIDSPTSNGGNTNSGEMAQRFTSPEIRSVICSLIKKSDDRENFEILLQDMNVIFSVTQGTRSDVNTEKLRQLGIDIMSNLRTKFLNTSGIPWIRINPSLHQMCAHSWEMINICKGPLSQFSEQSQEHWNKHVSRFKSGAGSRARQHSVKVNVQDIFTRMLMMTHPAITSKRRELRCSTCGELGHTARSVAFHALGPLKQEAAVIDSYYNN